LETPEFDVNPTYEFYIGSMPDTDVSPSLYAALIQCHILILIYQHNRFRFWIKVQFFMKLV